MPAHKYKTHFAIYVQVFIYSVVFVLIPPDFLLWPVSVMMHVKVAQ